VNKRHDAYHQIGNITFYLKGYLPDIEECKLLLTKMLEQAVRDYCTPYRISTNSELESWEQARDFLFDDNYHIDWGEGYYLDLQSILDILDIDINWFREQLQKKFERENPNGKEEKQIKKGFKS